jgi:hypothetical protein
MGVISESSPRSNSKSFVGRRRVSAVVAIPIVLMCGGLGFLLGSVFPPDSLLSRVEVKATTATAPADVVPTQVPVAQSLSLFEPRAPRPPEAGQPEARLALAPEKVALDGIDAGPEPLASNDSEHAEEAQDAPKGAAQKAARRAGEKRKGSPPNRTARVRRERNAPSGGPPATPAKSPSIISQVPIVGPVFGLLMP